MQIVAGLLLGTIERLGGMAAPRGLIYNVVACYLKSITIYEVYRKFLTHLQILFGITTTASICKFEFEF